MGQPYALAKDEMCRKTFNVSVRKLDSMQEMLANILICCVSMCRFAVEVDTVLLELKYTPKIKVIWK
jgi:hypothetical protein